jgi:protein gp37
MSAKTKIQWCDSTVRGCDGCEIWNSKIKTCYAGTLHTRFGGVTPGYASSFTGVTLFPGRMVEAARWSDLSGTMRKDKPWLDGLSRLIFVSDMSDSLSKIMTFESLRDEVITNVTSEAGKRHCWLWLTKRPERMAKFSSWLGAPWPDNLWAGTSVTTQVTTSRIDSLLRVGDERTIRFLSVEPQVERIDLLPWLPKLDWVIQGGESGRKARPFDIAWADDMINQCSQHGVALFIKQLGSEVTDRGECHRALQNQPLMGAFRTSHPLRAVSLINFTSLDGSRFGS